MIPQHPHRWLTALLCLGLISMLHSQPTDDDIEVFDVTNGLSHRNVFKILQDDQGFIWFATINGLNRYDGHEFQHYDTQSPRAALATDVVSDMVTLPNGHLLLAGPDFLTQFDPVTHTTQIQQIKRGAVIRRESLIPQSTCWLNQRAWCTVYDEKNGTYWLSVFRMPHQKQTIRQLKGGQHKHPLVAWQNQLWMADGSDTLYQLNAKGLPKSYLTLQASSGSTITDLHALGNELLILTGQGAVYQLRPNQQQATLLVQTPIVNNQDAVSLLKDADGNLWIGGLGMLWMYDSSTERWTDYDEPIRRQIRNVCTYRQLIQDQSGVVWAATDFGAVKINRSGHFFTQYLSGGNEYCSNLYCSTRGITADDAGNIYISYYNAIHVIDAATGLARPLFPRNNYFNFPFGITAYQQALYTGNGLRIDLRSLRVDTLFSHGAKDIGAVITTQKGGLLFGYEKELLHYQPATRKLTKPPVSDIPWDTTFGIIAYLYESPASGDLWVATVNNGAYRFSKGSYEHYHPDQPGHLGISHAQVNAVLETTPGHIWLSTAKGVSHINTHRPSSSKYDMEDGLPNSFINGILSEGDSCLWISTDNGLCRFSIATEQVLNFLPTMAFRLMSSTAYLFSNPQRGAFFRWPQWGQYFLA
ncbi:MAG: two-component regulator propeller domain-containing protein [Saprospiraceae bacterium]